MRNPSERARARNARLAGGIAHGTCGSRRNGVTALELCTVPSGACDSPVGIVFGNSL